MALSAAAIPQAWCGEVVRNGQCRADVDRLLTKTWLHTGLMAVQVFSPDHQHKVMIEAVENHMPEVIVIDEIGTEAEAVAARTIAQRGVQLVATAHGFQLDNLIKNPALADLVGGIAR